MEELKEKNTYDLLKDMDTMLYYLYTHNKNYTKEQMYKISDLVDYVAELENRLK